MREFRTSGSVRGAASNGRPYRERRSARPLNDACGSTQPDCHNLGFGEVGARNGHCPCDAPGVFSSPSLLELSDGRPLSEERARSFLH